MNKTPVNLLETEQALKKTIKDFILENKYRGQQATNMNRVLVNDFNPYLDGVYYLDENEEVQKEVRE